MGKREGFYEWSKNNTKQIRIKNDDHVLLKKVSKQTGIKMMHLISQAIQKEYGE